MKRFSPSPFSSNDLWRDWRVLCADIGERRAGTSEEERAANYIAEQFEHAGADEVTIETFPCASRRSAKVEVHERSGRSWRRIDSASLVGAPATPRGRPVTGELVWLELP